MSSWRDSASQQAQTDFDTLLSSCIGFTKKQIDEQGDFYPYAVVVDLDGHMQMVETELEDSHPNPASVIDALEGSLRAQRDSFRAVATVANVRLRQEDSDAVRVALEHSEGLIFAVVLPYRPKELGSSPTYGEMQLMRATSAIWSES